MPSQTWQTIAENKRKDLASKIPPEWVLYDVPSALDEPNAAIYLDKILPEDEKQITSSTLVSLSKQIASGKLTALQVTKAFCHRAAYAQQLLNCCCEIFFDRAFERAQSLDDYFNKHGGKTVGPLHGLPISLKDQVNLEGLETNIGYVGLLGTPKTAAEQSTIANLLLDLGAVFYVKTTVPMAMLAPDTYSNIFGDTQNSINRKLSPGGSSGGEGALIGARGSLLGLGTDIGGSIRIPSAFNGLYGLRPSFGRIPYHKVENSYSGQPIIPSVIGPLAQDIDDLEYFVKSLVDIEPWLYDPKIVPIPWREFEGSGSFTFGYYEEDGTFEVHPPVKRGLKMALEALKKDGHELIKCEPLYHRELCDITSKIFYADLGKEVDDTCALSGEPNIVKMFDSSKYNKPATVNEHWDDANTKYELQKKFFDYWNDTKKFTSSGKPVDAIISPVWHTAAFPPRTNEFPTYTMTMNATDCSVVIVPVTHVDKSVDSSKVDSFDPELYHGAPVCVQVITKRLEEEKAIALARRLRDALIQADA